MHNHKVTVEDLWTNDLIFKGEVLSVSDIKGESEWANRKALFKINKLILSETSYDTISIYTSSGSTSCGLYFKKGDTWLIFANGRKIFSASSCGNSRYQNNADAEQEISHITHFLDSLQSGNHIVREQIDGVERDYELLGEIVNGNPQGTWVKIVGSDTIARLNFRNGVQYGRQIDGSLPGVGTEENDIKYVNGEKIETRKIYGNKGGIRTTMQYKDGILHGDFIIQYKNWMEIGQYINGKEEGEWIDYSHDKIVSRKIYKAGKLIESFKYDQGGDLIEEKPH
jgi:antitoxin component YwqK of YwqJK toxin-antitoxin module